MRAQRRLTLKERTDKTVNEITRRYAEYVLVFTTLPDFGASVGPVLEAYGLLWQVELTFKRLKRGESRSLRLAAHLAATSGSRHSQRIRVGKQRVRQPMQEHGIRARGKRRFHVMTTDSRHDLPIAPNLLNRNFAKITLDPRG